MTLLALLTGGALALAGPADLFVRAPVAMGAMGLVMGLLDRADAGGRFFLADVVRRVGEGLALAALLLLVAEVDRRFFVLPPHPDVFGLVWPLVEGWPRGRPPT